MLWHIDENLELHPVSMFANSHLVSVEVDEETLAMLYRHEHERELIRIRLEELRGAQKHHSRREIEQ